MLKKIKILQYINNIPKSTHRILFNPFIWDPFKHYNTECHILQLTNIYSILPLTVTYTKCAELY